MKKGIHPEYFEDAQVICACGNTFTVGSTKKVVRTDVCSACHPLFTGEQRIVDTTGQVERYMQRAERKRKLDEEAEIRRAEKEAKLKAAEEALGEEKPRRRRPARAAKPKEKPKPEVRVEIIEKPRASEEAESQAKAQEEPQALPQEKPRRTIARATKAAQD